MLKGSCLCGGIRFEITGKHSKVVICHCSRCRKTSGAGSAAQLVVKYGGLLWLSGEDLVVNGPNMHSAACAALMHRTPTRARLCTSSPPAFSTTIPVSLLASTCSLVPRLIGKSSVPMAHPDSTLAVSAHLSPSISRHKLSGAHSFCLVRVH